MSKTATISARIDPAPKREAESVFHDLGLSASQAITLFYRQVQLRRGLPFEVRVPNEPTREALRQAETREGLTNLDSSDALFSDLGV
jgi:DNA-damage-inducible protein J